MAVGTIYTELDIDLTKFQAKQKTLVNQIQKVGKESELALQQSFMNLGVTSDRVYELMVTKAKVSYEKITNSGNASAAEQVRAQQAMAAQIKAINDKMREGANVHYATLGMKSAASINEQIANVQRAATAQQAIVGKSSADWIRIEHAKNEKLKELNNEMTGDHEMSMASMMRGVLRLYAAYYVFQMAVQFLATPFIKGFKAVEEYNTAVASMAAMVVTFGDNFKNLSLEDQWKGALAYSTKMIPVLEQIAARTLLSGQETIALANAFARGGVFIQANNKEALEGFTRLSNALPLLTQGQEIMRQINTEIRGLLTGMDTPSSMLLMTLKAIDPQIEKNLATWRATDTVMENIGRLLKGFGPATTILENQWQAVKTTIDTTFTILSRDIMTGAYGDIIKATQSLNKYLEDNKNSIRDFVEMFISSMKAIGDAITVYLLARLWLAIPAIAAWAKAATLALGPIGLVVLGIGSLSAAMEILKERTDAAERANQRMVKSFGDLTRAEATKQLAELTVTLKEQEQLYKRREDSFKRLGNAEYTAMQMQMSSEKQALDNTKNLIAALKHRIQLTVDEPEAAQKGNQIVRNMTQQVTAENTKNRKESMAEYQKMVNDQVAAFRKAGYSKVEIDKYIAAQKIRIEQKFAAEIKQTESDRFAASSSKNKEYYEDAITKSNHWLKLQRIAGQNDFEATTQVMNDKKVALDIWYKAEKTNIQKNVSDASARYKDLAKLDREYSKSKNQIAYEDIEGTATAIKKELEILRKLQNERDLIGKIGHELKLKQFDQETTHLMASLTKGNAAYKEAQEIRKDLRINIEDGFRKESAFHSANWERIQELAQLEFQRTQGGKRVAISAETWDKIREYEQLTGKKLESGQIAYVDLLVDEYNRYLGTIKAGINWERIQELAQLEYMRTQGGKRVEISATTWDSIREYEQLTGKKLEADQIAYVDLLIDEYNRYLGTIKAGINWERIQQLAKLESIRTNEGKRREISAETWDNIREYEQLTGKKLEADQIGYVDLLIDEYNRYLGTIKSGINWERIQELAKLEFHRTQGGKRVEISAETWDKIREYEQLTGKKLEAGQIAYVDLLVDEYNLYLGTIKAGMNWERIQQLAQLEFQRTQGGKRVAISADTWDSIREYEQLTGKKLEAGQIAYVDLLIDEYNRYLGTIKSGINWERIQELAQLEYIRTQGGKRVEISADTWDKMTQYQSMTGKKLTAEEIQNIDAVIAEYWGMSAELADFYSKIMGYEAEYRQNKLDWIDKEEKRLAALYKNDVAAAKWAAQEKEKLNRAAIDAIGTKFDYDNKYTKDTITNMSKVLDAAMNMYDKDSSEYNRIAEWKRGIQVAEMAMEVAKNVQFMSFMAAENAAYIVAMAKKAASIQLTAAEVILTQGKGEPYTAFARMATMTAIVAGILGMVGLAMGGSGGGATVTATAPALPASTVLGAAAGTGSESVSKGWELLQDTYDMQYRELSGIHNSMKDLNRNITGLVTSIVRTGGVNIASMGIATGTELGAMQKLNDQIVKFMYLGTEKIFNTLTFGLTGWIDKQLSGFIGSIFGGKTDTWVGGSGIQIGGASVGALQAGGAVTGQQYVDIGRKTSGGWFGSDRYDYWTEYRALDASVNDMFTKVFKNLSDTLLELSKGLGTDTQSAVNYVFQTTRISLAGLDAAGISKAITEYISRAGDEAVQALFGEMLRAYQQIGEGLLETAVRVMVGKEVILETLRMTNQAFVGSTAATIEFSESLITLAGGLDKLREATEKYYDKFFNDAEKQAKTKSDLIVGLGVYGLDLPGQRADYRALVESLNLTTTAGQEAYVALMQMSESADQYYKYLEDAKGKIKPEQYATSLDYQRALAVQGFSDGGSFQGGWRMVGERGPELEFTGPSNIVSHDKSRSLLDTSELVKEVRALREDVSRGNIAIATYTQKTAKLLDQWNGEGTPPVRT